jgi:hypothetical protein
MLSKEEMAEFAKDIKANGLREPIVLYDGMILDGRNRYEACKLAGVKPQFTELPELIPGSASPVQYVVSANLYRRHLTTSQRATIAAEMIPMLQEEAKKRQATSTGGCYGAKPLQAKLPEGVCSNNFNGLRGQARDIAARAVGVGGRTVQKALTLKKAEPETFEKIKRGEITVEKALHETKTSVPGKRQQIVASAAYRRMVACFAQIEGGCKGLNGLNLRVALTQCPNGEKKHWRREVLERTKELRAFGRELQRAEK